MSTIEERFFSELRRLTNEIEDLVAEYGMEDRFVCTACYGIIDEPSDDGEEDEYASISAIYNFSVDGAEELDVLLETIRKAYKRLTKDDNGDFMSSIFYDPSVN